MKSIRRDSSVSDYRGPGAVPGLRSGARGVVALVLLAAGCGTDAGERAARDWAGAMDTIGGVVRVTNPAEGAWRAEDAWRLEPAVRIGGATDGGPGTFANISALEVGPDGRVYVLDRQANQLRIFDRSGAHVRTVGGSGRGPAEFVRANGLQWLGDTLVVIDGAGSRYTLMDAEGALLNTVPRPVPSYGWTFQGGADGGMLYESGLVQRDDGYRTAIFGIRMAGLPALVDTVDFPATRAAGMQPFEVATSDEASSLSVPFWPGTAWHMNGDGTFWYGHAAEHRLLRLTLDGDTVREVVTAAPPEAVTLQDLAAWRATNPVRQFEQLGGTIDGARIPRQKPFFRELFTDDAGNIWVEPYTSGASSFDIFDAQGRYLGRVATWVVRDATVKPIARGGFLYLVGTGFVEVIRVVGDGA